MNLLSLFSGGGLADTGAAQAGFVPVGAVEYDEEIAAAYRANLGSHITCARVQDVAYRPFTGVDALWASPSCVNASVANQDAGETEADREAAEAVCRALREARPRWFVLENVYGYRSFDSFRAICRELQSLGYQWSYQHVNAANFGVAQTRKRLILRAVLGGPVPPLTATHCRGGGMESLFGAGLLPWVGWYAAVEDLIPTLPESRLADWQRKRLPPELLETLLISGAATTRGDSGPSCVLLGCDEGSVTLTAEVGSKVPLRALLVGQQSNLPSDCPDRRPSTAGADEPAMTVVGSHHSKGKMPQAVLVSNATTEYSDGTRQPPEPAFTTTSEQRHGRRGAVLVDGKPTNYAGDLRLEGPARDSPVLTGSQSQHPFRAVLVGGGNTSDEQAAIGVGCSESDEPTRCVAPNGDRWKATDGYRVVAMTPRALARFQSVPDDYILPTKNALACRIVGNGVPCLLARRIMESFLQ